MSPYPAWGSAVMAGVCGRARGLAAAGGVRRRCSSNSVMSVVATPSAAMAHAVWLLWPSSDEFQGIAFWNWNCTRTELSSGTIRVESLADQALGTRNIRS